MKRKLLVTASVLAIALVLAAGATARAADVAVQSYEPVAFDWTGFHVGAGGGYLSALHQGQADLFLDIEVNNVPVGAPFPIPLLELENNDLGDQAGFGTAEIGYDYQFYDRLVVGLIGSYDVFDTSARSSFCVLDCDANELASFNTDVQLDDMWTVAGRLGFLATETTLVYVLGGYSWANIDTHADLSVPILLADPLFQTNDSGTAEGYTVGAGIETMFHENFSLKLEYRYSDLGSFNGNNRDDFLIPGTPVDLVFDTGTHYDTTVQSIRAVASWRF